MSDRVTKFLRTLPEKQRRQMIQVIERIVAQDLAGLDVKKLHGREAAYRVRMGSFRVMYAMTERGPRIFGAERRSDTTYR